MSFGLLATNAAPVVPLTSATVVTFLLGSITILLGIVAWFLQREIKNNDEAHRQLKASIDETRRELKADVKTVEANVKTVEASVKQLLAGQSRIEGLLQGRQQALAEAPYRLPLADFGRGMS